jgi:uncharacterized protein YyaL (SSP411 family)
MTDDHDEHSSAPTNRLGNESSAYLLQHSRNPVDWYPWGDEALERAREEDRPLLISIGYSSCHWCHVMERESFEDPEIAALMNELFVCIKVDREERPDVDQIYMDTVVRLNGQGGWPLNVFCLPDGSPFYGGTYYPEKPRHGMPSFRQVLTSVAEAYRERRDQVVDAAGQIVASLEPPQLEAAQAAPGAADVVEAAQLIMRSADEKRGGFGDGPKFPTPTNLELLIAAMDFMPADAAQQVGRQLALTCREMARRGLYDHLAGGFHRYCVDGDWTIPHFEKMLYDQGLLLRVYTEVCRRSGDEAEFAWPIHETALFLRREMTSPEGGLYASQDADADGVEGAFQVWTPQQVEEVLGKDAKAFCKAYGVDRRGNFEHGTTHLIDHARGQREDFADERAALLAMRSRRVAPATDRKRVASWNGYAISGLARAGSVLGDAEILSDATHAMDFVLDEMVDASGRLHRVFNQGRASVPAFLDDHAALLDACLDLYRAGAGETYLTAAIHFAEEIGERFFDAETGELFFTPVDGEPLVHRPRTDHDGATPSAAGLAVVGWVRLAGLSGFAPIRERADKAIDQQAPLIARSPHALPTLMRAVAIRSRGLSVALIVGDPAARETAALAERARRVLLPDDAVVVVRPGEPAPSGVDRAWLEGRADKDGVPTAYVCRGRACTLPATHPDELEAGLAGL